MLRGQHLCGMAAHRISHQMDARQVQGIHELGQDIDMG
jgi:hypothetical protein